MDRLIAAPSLVLALACGPATGDMTSAESSTSEPSSSGSSSFAETTSTAESPTTAVDASTGPASPTSGAAEGTTDITTTSTTDITTTAPGSTDTTTDSESTGTSSLLVTRAWWVNGDLLQIRVLQQHDGPGLCRGVILEALTDGGTDSPKYAPVEQPVDWGVRYVFVHANVDDCFDPYFWYENDPAHADSATGTVVFHDLDDVGKPATLDLEVTGVYTPLQPWTPPEDLLLAPGVPVEVG
jgi:hypothetical protein